MYIGSFMLLILNLPMVGLFVNLLRFFEQDYQRSGEILRQIVKK